MFFQTSSSTETMLFFWAGGCQYMPVFCVMICGMASRIPSIYALQRTFCLSHARNTEVGKLLDSLVAKVSEMGQRQPHSTITTDHGIKLRVLPGNVAQKWLGCMVTAHASEQKIFGSQIPPPASGKGVSCQQMDFGRRGGSHFSASSPPTILKLLFHWLCALQVGIVPCTKNAYRVWTFTFANADPLWALRTLTRHLNGMRFCKLGPNEPRVLLASRRYRVGPEFVVVRIGNWPLTLTNFLFHHWIQTISHSQHCGAKATWTAETPLGQQTGGHCARL